jgi:hypothetical protein
LQRLQSRIDVAYDSSVPEHQVPIFWRFIEDLDVTEIKLVQPI